MQKKLRLVLGCSDTSDSENRRIFSSSQYLQDEEAPFGGNSSKLLFAPQEGSFAGANMSRRQVGKPKGEDGVAFSLDKNNENIIQENTF